jgi:hypothetical protein
MEIYVILAILVVWLIIVSVLVLTQARFLRRLTKDTDKGNLNQILKRILDKQDLSAKEIDAVKKELVRQYGWGLTHVQKVGLIRFNPFRETGGDHSFSLAVLDGNESGFIITGLHTRERTRLYIKEMLKGKSDVALSSEETKALRKAQRQRLE